MIFMKLNLDLFRYQIQECSLYYMISFAQSYCYKEDFISLYELSAWMLFQLHGSAAFYFYLITYLEWHYYFINSKYLTVGVS